VRRLRPELWRQLTGCWTTTTHRLTVPLHQGIFDRKQHDCSPQPIILSSVFPIEDKTENPPF
jgi:hypothetical protein